MLFIPEGCKNRGISLGILGVNTLFSGGGVLVNKCGIILKGLFIILIGSLNVTS